MADDLSSFPIMDDPGIDVGNTFSDFDPSGSAAVDAGANFSWGSIWDMISSPTAKTLLSAGSGLYGLYQSGQQRGLAKDAIKASDPFGPYRQQYAQKLMALMADPASITKDPGYQFQLEQGEQAVERRMASKGYLGSGNEGIALEQYGQDYAKSAYNDKITQFAGLAGANISPNPGPGLQAYNQGLDTASASLASLGYAVAKGGASAGTPGYSIGTTPSPSSRPSAAGGEAAKTIGMIGGAAGVVGAGAKLAGSALGSSETATDIGKGAGAVGDLASIYTGIDKGGVKGYGDAVAGIADLAGYNIKSAPVFAIAGAAQQVAKGNVGGAGVTIASAAVPIAGLGFALTGLANKAFFGNTTFQRNSANWMKDTGAQQVTLGRNLSVIKLPDGTIVPSGSVKDLSAAYYSAAFEGGDPQAYYDAIKGITPMTGINPNAKALTSADTSKGNIYGRLAGPG